MVTAGVGLFEWCVENFGLLVNFFVDPIIHVHSVYCCTFYFSTPDATAIVRSGATGTSFGIAVADAFAAV